MNPCDALPGDWNMYYDGCYMWHTKLDKAVLVSCDDGLLQHYDKKTEVYIKAEPDELICWWPRSGAYNTGGQAIFVGRRARRSMRKSAYDHYFCQWGNDRGHNVLRLMAEGPNFLTYQAARECLNKRVMECAAISADLILARNRADERDYFDVIYRGTLAGELKEEQFIPYFNGTPAAKRAELKLVQEGVRCI